MPRTLDRRSLVDAIRQQHERQPFSGVIDVREGGHVVFAEAFGWAQRAERIPNRLDTRFAIASGTKTLTSIAVLQLIDRGLATLDTPLADCLARPLPQLDRAVTLHHLLCHCSGVPDYFDEAVMDDYEALWRERPMYRFTEPSDFLPLFAHLPMRAEPGSVWAYSNAGYVLLGLVVEHLADLPYTTYVERNVLEPCGMAASGFFPLDRLPAGTAYGYLPTDDGGWRTNAYALPIVGGPDGGMYTTVADLARLWDALLDGGLVSDAMRERMLTPHWRTDPEGDDQHYGYGLWITKRYGRPRSYALLGEDPGVSFTSVYAPDTRMQWSVLGNSVAASRAMRDVIAPILASA